jgi:hypothetical protein
MKNECVTLTGQKFLHRIYTTVGGLKTTYTILPERGLVVDTFLQNQGETDFRHWRCHREKWPQTNGTLPLRGHVRSYRHFCWRTEPTHSAWHPKRPNCHATPSTQPKGFFGAAEELEKGAERPTLYHLIRRWKRQKQHHIASVRDSQGFVCTSTTAKLRVFAEHLHLKCTRLDVDQAAIQHLLSGVHVRLDEAALF